MSPLEDPNKGIKDNNLHFLLDNLKKSTFFKKLFFKKGFFNLKKNIIIIYKIVQSF